MSIDDLLARASSDLRGASNPDIDHALADLERRRRRRTTTRALAAAGIVAVTVAAVTVPTARQHTQPAEQTPGVSNGALVGITPRTGVMRAHLVLGDLESAAAPEELIAGTGCCASFSEDGTTLRYFEPEPMEVVELDLATGRRETLWTCPRRTATYCTPLVSPDGSKIALARASSIGVVDEDTGEVTRASGLEVVDLATGRHVELEVHPWARWVAWSPDDVTLAVVTKQGIELVSTDRAGSRPRLAVPLDRASTWPSFRPAWSPDGTRIAFAAPEMRSRSQWTDFRLAVADVLTSEVDHVADLGSCVCKSLSPPQVAWSPDGRLIAATTLSGRSLAMSGDVVVMRPDGSESEVVGSNRNYFDLVWQPVSSTE